MKKWAPFSSLIEQATCLEQMKYERNKIEKPILTPDQIEKIELTLQNYQKGQIIKIKFFNNGYLYEIETSIRKIDVENRCLVLDKGKLGFDKIIDIDSQNWF